MPVCAVPTMSSICPVRLPQVFGRVQVTRPPAESRVSCANARQVSRDDAFLRNGARMAPTDAVIHSVLDLLQVRRGPARGIAPDGDGRCPLRAVSRHAAAANGGPASVSCPTGSRGSASRISSSHGFCRARHPDDRVGERCQRCRLAYSCRLAAASQPALSQYCHTLGRRSQLFARQTRSSTHAVIAGPEPAVC
jgi:hypothetical protein